jgi:nucleotidyltransferase/DNA polymerase involved in DNA repair
MIGTGPSRPRPQPLWVRLEIDQYAAQAVFAATPGLRQVPFGVVRQQEDSHKASLFAVSQCARNRGVEPGMPVFIARRKVGREFRVVGRDEAAESTIREAVRELCAEWTPEQQVGATSAWLDLSGTPISRALSWGEVGARLSTEVQQRSGLQQLAVGVSASRVVAQILARQARPQGVITCPVGQEQERLSSVDADSLPGLAAACRDRAHMYGLDRVEQLLDLDRNTLIRRFGKEEGARIYGLVRGMASEPQRPRDERTSAETVLPKDVNDESLLHEAVRLTADKTTDELRRASLVTRAVRLELVYSDNRRAQKTIRLSASTDDFPSISGASLAAFAELHVRRVALKSIVVTALRTSPATGQHDLFDGLRQQKSRRLGAAITSIRQRMGFDAVVPAGSLSLVRD